MIPRLALPPSPTVLALIALAFVVPGLLGHDPWKAFDVVGIEIAHEMLRSGDWLVPQLAGEPWLEDPPLYHWVALAFGKALGWLLPFHEGARLASGFFMLLALWLLYLAARAWAAAEERAAAGASAALLLVGSVGLIVHAHEAIPDLATMAASAGAFAALARAGRPRAAMAALAWGAAFGAALGAAFLSTGLIVPAALAAAVLLAHLVCAEWRSRRSLAFLGAAALAATALAATWPLALALHAPAALEVWWAHATQTRGELVANLRYFVAVASWFAWPAWPLALWAAWSLRRRWREPQLFVPLAATLLLLLGISLAGPAQDINALALLVPLALLAVRGVAVLRRGAAAALDWFGVMTFGFFAGLVWLGYVAMMTGVPPRVANNFVKIAPGFTAHFDPLPFAFAVALTLAWLYLVFFTRPSPTRSLVRWAAGLILLWGSFATLWLPWVDYQRSYRSVALQLRSKIPPGTACVSARNLGAPQRAALDYHGGLRTEPFDFRRPQACPLLLVQGNPRDERDGPGPDWIKLADVGRAGDKNERYRLYRLER